MLEGRHLRVGDEVALRTERVACALADPCPARRWVRPRGAQCAQASSDRRFRPAVPWRSGRDAPGGRGVWRFAEVAGARSSWTCVDNPGAEAFRRGN